MTLSRNEATIEAVKERVNQYLICGCWSTKRGEAIESEILCSSIYRTIEKSSSIRWHR